MATTVTARTQISWVDLRVVATLKSQNISNNTSTIQFDVYLDSRGGNNWYGMGSTFSLNVGSSWFTPSIYIQDWKTNGGTYHVATWHYTMDHKHDGTRSFAFSASMASGYGNGTASGSMDLPDIPRATEISTFSTSSSLTKGKELKFSYTLDKKATSHISDISLVHRGITVATSNGVTSSNSTITISADNVDKIISRETGSSASIQMRLQTKQSNGTNVGSVQTKTISVSISTAGTVPTVSSFSRAILGSSTIGNRDKTLNTPIAGYTRVRISANVSTMSGTSVNTVTLKVSGKETYSINMVRNSSTGKYEGTTRVLYGGTYYFDVEVKDSRGQTGNYGKQKYDVSDYRLPTLEALHVERQLSNPSKLDVEFRAKFTSGITGNIEVSYRDTNSTSWYSIYSAVSKDNSTAITVGGQTSTRTDMDSVIAGVRTVTVNQEFTGFSETTSYQLRVRVNDSIITSYTYMYGNIGTATQLLTLNKDNGVGIGKFHEKGVLDVAGEAHFEGELHVVPDDTSTASNISLYSSSGYNAGIRLKNSDGVNNASMGYIYSSDSKRLSLINHRGVLELMGNGGDVQLRASSDNYVTISDNASGNTHTRVIDQGATYYNGSYVKMYNGTLICWHTMTITTTSDRNNYAEWNYPVEFYSTSSQVVMASKSSYSGAYRYQNGSVGVSTDTKLKAKVVFSFATHDTHTPDENFEVNLIAIGRWK